MGDYLRLRKGIYHFRRKVPANLIGILGVQEIIKSTGTGDRRLAQRKSREFLVFTDKLFEVGKSELLMPGQDFEELAKRLYLQWRQSFEQGLAKQKDPENHGDNIVQLLELTKTALNNNKSELSNSFVRRFMEAESVSFEPDSIEEKTFNRFALRAKLASLENLKANYQGNYGFEPNDILFSSNEIRHLKNEQNNKGRSNLPLFSIAAEEYLEKRLVEGAISLKTANDYRVACRKLVETVGDKSFDLYTRADISAYMDTATLVPNNWHQSREYRGLTFKEIVRKTKGQDIQRLSQRALGKHLRALSVFYSEQLRNGTMDGENPTRYYKISRGAPAPKIRELWPPDMLIKLFSAPVWTGAKSRHRLKQKGEVFISNHKYWLPILALYHGNRTEEFAQLRIEDLKQDEGIFYFHLTNEDGRKLKNPNSKRCVPLHPFVLKLGFIDYYESVSQNSSARIFPEMKGDAFEGKFGTNYSKWFTRYRQELGVYKKLQDAHSFRHNATNMLFKKDVAEHLIDEITGHKGGSISRSVYKGKMPIKKLFDAISHIEWPEVEELLLKQKREF